MALIAVMSVIYHCIILLHHLAELKQCSRFTLKECALARRFHRVKKINLATSVDPHNHKEIRFIAADADSKYVSSNVTLLENAFCFVINIK